MRSHLILGLSGMLLLCAAVYSQSTYDGRDGPHVFGPPGQQVYIRGQNEGPYNVPGVGGTFQNSPAGGAHVYTDERGNTYVHQKNGAGGKGTHSINGPDLVAHRGQAQPGSSATGEPAPSAYRGRRGVIVSRPDRIVTSGGGGTYISRNSRDLHVSRPDRTVDVSNDGFSIERQRRGVVVSRPDRVVISGGGGTYISRNSRDLHVSRPDRTVDVSNGGFVIQRHRRSPQPQSGYVTRADGRSVSYGPGGFIAQGQDGRTVGQSHSRRRRARVQGKNFVARDDQAGVWNDNVSVWKRPDGRTVTVDSDGNVITSGSPNGRGPQRYSG